MTGTSGKIRKGAKGKECDEEKDRGSRGRKRVWKRINNMHDSTHGSQPIQKSPYTLQAEGRNDAKSNLLAHKKALLRLLPFIYISETKPNSADF